MQRKPVQREAYQRHDRATNEHENFNGREQRAHTQPTSQVPD